MSETSNQNTIAKSSLKEPPSVPKSTLLITNH